MSEVKDVKEMDSKIVEDAEMFAKVLEYLTKEGPIQDFIQKIVDGALMEMIAMPFTYFPPDKFGMIYSNRQQYDEIVRRAMVQYNRSMISGLAALSNPKSLEVTMKTFGRRMTDKVKEDKE